MKLNSKEDSRQGSLRGDAVDNCYKGSVLVSQKILELIVSFGTISHVLVFCEVNYQSYVTRFYVNHVFGSEGSISSNVFDGLSSIRTPV